jgi:DNA primase catalytic subunit
MNSHAYYSRPDVQDELVRISKDREIQVWFGIDKKGRRPEILQYVGDLKTLIRRGMTSLHISEERWIDPLMLKPGMAKKVLNENRKGWDLVFDIDAKDFEFSRMAAELIIDFLENVVNINCVTNKFSGNKGFHIGVPFEAFPGEVNGIHIKDYFPEGTRTIAEFICEKIKPFLINKILDWKDMDTLASEYFEGKKDDMFKKGEFNPFSLVDVDSVLISSRHLLRAPYVFNEKSGYVSIMVYDIKNFTKDMAKPENVKVDSSFLDASKVVPGEAGQLITEALDWSTESKVKEDFVKIEEKQFAKKEFEMPTVEIDEAFFPPCIQKMLNGVVEDGRKRALFILLNFLRHAAWSWEKIEERLNKWNDDNYEMLKEGYIRSQISWSKRQAKPILPPNCDNEAYYKALRVCNPDGLCGKAKNPVNYMMRKLSLESYKKRKNTKGKKEDKKSKVSKEEGTEVTKTKAEEGAS